MMWCPSSMPDFPTEVHRRAFGLMIAVMRSEITTLSPSW